MSGRHSSMHRDKKLAKLLVGAVPDHSAGPVPIPITELNWIQMWNVGPCSCPVSNNVTGDS